MTGAGSITFVAGGLLVLVAWAVGAIGLPEAYRPLTEVLAEPIALLLVVLAWRYRRSRLATTAILIALANVLVRGPLDLSSGSLGSAGGAALALLLPLNLGVIVCCCSRGWWPRSCTSHAASSGQSAPTGIGSGCSV
jgi:hypothetical protein